MKLVVDVPHLTRSLAGIPREMQGYTLTEWDFEIGFFRLKISSTAEFITSAAFDLSSASSPQSAGKIEGGIPQISLNFLEKW